jgi:hypothetical protein
MNNWNIYRYNMKIMIIVSFLIFIHCTSFSQSDSPYSIFVAGHAYGAHLGKNIGLHPPFLNKLKAIQDKDIMGLFLTGDIINNSTTASWAQVAAELSGIGLNAYYVMGNHDDNSIGFDIFQKKHGGMYYYFTYQNELYIVLNSTESDRSISPTQLIFLDNILKNTDSNWKRAFIFFHEVIWNSNEKYRLVRSNSRSRFDQMVTVSNFWQDVYPRLTANHNKQFYLFAGDVGGNADAIAASYDQWANVTLISSGMGEVADENILKVNILPDTVTFQLIPLSSGVEMKPLTWYNIPEKPTPIEGPSVVTMSDLVINYRVPAVVNATSYRWSLSGGMSGSSISSAIDVHFSSQFQQGKISVTAINDGFGESEPSELEVHAEGTAIAENSIGSRFEIRQNEQNIEISMLSERKQNAQLRIFDVTGRLLFNDQLILNSGLNSRLVESLKLQHRIVLVELSAGNIRQIKKVLVR